VPVSSDQIGIIVLLLALLALFAIDRFRIELVALTGLGIAVLAGLVPLSGVFSGFSNPAVVTVVEILLIVQALSRTRMLNVIADHIGRSLSSERAILSVLCVMGASLSVFMNNIGALALMLPITLSVAKRSGMAPQQLIMPVSFATLLGGLCSIIGTPPNYLVSEFSRTSGGGAFGFFDFAYAGAPVAIAGLVILILWAPGRLMRDKPGNSKETPAPLRRLITEIRPGPALEQPLTVALLAQRLSGSIHTILREGSRVFPLTDELVIESQDILLVDARLDDLEAEIDRGTLVLAAGNGSLSRQRAEIVVLPHSTLVGSRIGMLSILNSRGIEVLAVSSQTVRIEGRLDDIRLEVGDILYLHGSPETVSHALEASDTLQLWPLSRLEPAETSYWPLAIFMAGVAGAATGIVDPPVAFGAVVLVLSLLGMLDLRATIPALNWPIILMLAAMIPIGEAIATTGTATVIASGLTSLLPAGSGFTAISAMLLLALLITPFINNATTAIILAPIALGLAQATDVSPMALLMAVALGASTDFLTPFGHHNNTLAFSIGNYRFSTFLKVGLPITVSSLVIGTILITLIW